MFRNQKGGVELGLSILTHSFLMQGRNSTGNIGLDRALKKDIVGRRRREEGGAPQKEKGQREGEDNVC